MNKQSVIDQIIKVEGGYVNDPSDSGGETNFGITLKTARDAGYDGSMEDMPRQIAFDIYARKYWVTVSADELMMLAPVIAEEVVDTGVNMGPGRAGKFLQRSLNVFNNKGQMYADVVVDGDVGPATLRALRAYLSLRDARILARALNCMQGAFYIELAERREKDERFAYGWLKKSGGVMKLLDILTTVGAGLISTMVPGGPLIVGAINAALPNDKQLPENATGSQAMSAIAALPVDKQAVILERQFDVDITQIKESHSTVRAMLEAESQSKHTTRPYIAKGSFIVVAFAIVVTISVWAVGILRGDADIVDAVTDGWPFMLAVIGPLVTLLWAYFGILKNEHKNRLNAATGTNVQTGIAAIIKKVMS